MIALNALSQILALGGVLVIQTVYMFLVARFLGPEDFGWFAFAWSIVQMMLVGGDLGTHNTTLRWLAGDRREAGEVIPVFLFVKGSIAGALLLLTVLLAIFLEIPGEVRRALLIFGGGMLVQSFSTAFNIVHQAYDRLYLASLNIFLVFFFQAVLGITFLLLGGHLILLGTAYGVAVLFAAAINLQLYLRHRHPIGFRRRGAGEFIRDSLAVGLATLFRTVSARIAIPLVTFLAGPYHAGIYSGALRFPQALANVPTGILSAVFPSLAAKSPRTFGFRRLLRRTLLTMTVIAVPTALALYVTAPRLIRWIYGREYEEAIPVLRQLAWLVIPMFLGMAFSQVLLSQRSLVRFLPWVAAGGLGVNLMLGFLLIPSHLSLGAAWTLLLTETLLALGYAAAARPELRRRPDLGAWAPGEQDGPPRVAVVIQRYGEGIIGGAEVLAREVVRRLNARYRIDVLTSCARDHRDWADEYPEGVQDTGAERILRFPVAQRRHWKLFGLVSGVLFAWQRNFGLPRFAERLWVAAQGPAVPDLVRYLQRFGDRYEAVVFFGYLYYPTVFGLPRVAERAVLVPQMHDEPAARFTIYQELLQQPRYLVFMTEAERDFVHRRFGIAEIPHEVAGYGVEIGGESEGEAADGVDLLYLGRVEVGKGCRELFEYCRRIGVSLTVAGPTQMEMPPHVRYLGVVSEQDKERLLARCRALVVPSLLESLSMVTLEAWAHGKPVVARKGGVVERLVRESGGGLCYGNLEEFRRAVAAVDRALGERGRRYVREHYSWERVLSGFIRAVESVRLGRRRR